MTTYVKLYVDEARVVVVYAGDNLIEAEEKTIEDVEGDKYINFGNAGHKLQVWENGIKISETEEKLTHAYYIMKELEYICSEEPQLISEDTVVFPDYDYRREAEADKLLSDFYTKTKD